MSGIVPEKKQMSHQRTSYLIYDGDCGFCDASVRLAARYNRDVTLTFLPFQSLTPDRLAGLGIDPAECAGAVQLVTTGGTVLAGAFAINHLLRQRPSGALLVRLIEILPPLLWLEQAGYRLVARNRARLSAWFGLHACPLPARFPDTPGDPGKFQSPTTSPASITASTIRDS